MERPPSARPPRRAVLRRSAVPGSLLSLLGLLAASGACASPDPGINHRSGTGLESPRAAAEREGTKPHSGPSADGRVVLVTGSTSGLGREVARSLARQGDHVIVHGRNVERGTELVREIEEETRGSARFYPADFASLDRVRELGEELLRDYDRLDVLVNNAGVWLEDSEGRRLSEDGHELHFQVNYLAGYLLTEILLPLLRESAPSRIVNVASVAQRPIDFEDVMLEEGYSAGRGYAQSKLAQVLFTFSLAEELQGTGVTVNALHPATMMPTGMVLSRGAEPHSELEEGLEAVLHLVNGSDVGTGNYFSGTRPARAHDQAYDEDIRDRLMRLSAELTGS